MLKPVVVTTVLACVAHASPVSSFMLSRATPPGFFACSEIRKDLGCLVAPNSAPNAVDSEELRRMLNSVNDFVNETLRMHECADDVHNGPDGEPNWWTSFGEAGYFRDACANCITYAVSKRRALLTRGLPPNSVRFALVHNYGAGNINHVLVLVYTDRYPYDPYDPYVLDSLGAFGNADIIWHLNDVAGYYRYTLLAIQDARGTWQKS